MIKDGSEVNQNPSEKKKLNVLELTKINLLKTCSKNLFITTEKLEAIPVQISLNYSMIYK